MRTILVNHLLEPPGRVTGITRFVFALLAAWLKVSEDTLVLLTSWESDDLPPALLHPRLRVMTRKYFKSTLLNSTLQNLVVRAAMRETRAAIELNTNPLGCWTGAWPRLVTVHDMYLNSMPDAYAPRHRAIWNNLFPRVASSADRILVPSSSTGRDIKKFFPAVADRIDVIPEAPALDITIPASARLLEGRYGLIVGNISPNKNAGVIVEALAILARRGVVIPMLHVGRDEARVLPQAYAAHPDAPRIVSQAGVDDSVLKSAYAHASFFINTSLHEGFCLPIVEAQLLGVPVIASDRSAIPEVAGDGAMLIDPTSPLQIADAMALVWSNPEVAETLRRRGEANVARYSWTKTAQAISAIIDSCIGTAPKPHRKTVAAPSSPARETTHA